MMVVRQQHRQKLPYKIFSKPNPKRQFRDCRIKSPEKWITNYASTDQNKLKLHNGLGFSGDKDFRLSTRMLRPSAASPS